MPGPPRESDKPITSRRWTVDLHNVAVVRAGARYVVAFADHPLSEAEASQPESLLKWAGNNVATRYHILYREPITVDNTPGLALRYSDDKGVLFRSRMFQVKTRLYQIMVSGRESAIYSTSAQRFMDSFKLVKT